jgi:hypothetical protein
MDSWSVSGLFIILFSVIHVLDGAAENVNDDNRTSASANREHQGEDFKTPTWLASKAILLVDL